MYTGNKSCKVSSSVSKSSGHYASDVIGSVGATHYIPKSKQQCNHKQRQQDRKPAEDNRSITVVAKQSIVHKSPLTRQAITSTATHRNAVSSNAKIESGFNLRSANSKWKSSTWHTNISATKNASSNSSTRKTSSNDKGTTSNYKSKPTNVSTAKNPSTVLISNNTASTPSWRDTISKGNYYNNSSVPSNGGPTQHHSKGYHKSLKNVKERNEAPKNTGT